jgi:hypothetical protein
VTPNKRNPHRYRYSRRRFWNEKGPIPSPLIDPRTNLTFEPVAIDSAELKLARNQNPDLIPTLFATLWLLELPGLLILFFAFGRFWSLISYRKGIQVQIELESRNLK